MYRPVSGVVIPVAGADEPYDPYAFSGYNSFRQNRQYLSPVPHDLGYGSRNPKVAFQEPSTGSVSSRSTYLKEKTNDKTYC